MNWTLMILSAIAAAALLGGFTTFVLAYNGYFINDTVGVLFGWLGVIVFGVMMVVGGFYVEAYIELSRDEFNNFLLFAIIAPIAYAAFGTVITSEVS